MSAAAKKKITTDLAVRDDGSKSKISALAAVAEQAGLAGVKRPEEASAKLSKRRAAHAICRTAGNIGGGVIAAKGGPLAGVAVAVSVASHLLSIAGVGSSGGVLGAVLETANGVGGGVAAAKAYEIAKGE